MMEKFKDLIKDDAEAESYPSYALMSLARRGMEKISLDQCFLKNCDNQDLNMLERLNIEESETEEMHTKIVTLKCKKCNSENIERLLSGFSVGGSRDKSSSGPSCPTGTCPIC